ncbi:MAG: VWA domain-containing protein [bacterium]|nr:VWA domain-containing protein [bacterium]
MFHFASPYWLLGLLSLPLIFWWHLKKKHSTMRFTSVDSFAGIKESFRIKLYKILPFIEVFTIGVLLIGLARPQIGKTYEEIVTKGIDIILVLDISSTMNTIDFPPDYSVDKIEGTLRSGHQESLPIRLQIAKNAAKDFINGRKGDRIGLVLFSQQAFTQCPLTLDYNILLKLLDEAKIGMIEDGTAVGMGIATAVNRIKDSDGKSKIIILLTDGINNAGKIDPMTASQLAKTMNIKIYTIGVGNKGISVYPVQTGLGVRFAEVKEQLDEEQLQKIADVTSGLYFRADSPDALKGIYKTIDKLEKVDIKTKRYTLYREIYKYFVYIGLLSLLLYISLILVIIAKIP